ncbi:MAG: hypothetical protein QOK02_2421 [Mycobacterium sp.]|nr:hypothetical protein [Mycobacterium sp.]
MRSRRVIRVTVGLLVIAATLAFVLTSCPSNRDGMPGQLATAKDDTQSAARSAALALQMWAQHSSTRNLTSVQLADARDEVVKAFRGIATLKAEDPADLGRQLMLTRAMTDVVGTINDANAAVRALPGRPDPRALGQRLVDDADALERDYR